MTRGNTKNQRYEERAAGSSAPALILTAIAIFGLAVLLMYIAIAEPQAGTAMGAIRDVMRGLGGSLCYALPLVLAWAGVLCIFAARGRRVSIIKTIVDILMILTFFAGVLDLKTGRLQFCNAGHDNPIVRIGKEARFMEVTPNVPLGVDAGWDYKTQEVTLAPGTMVFFYTDGLTEAETVAHEQFGRDRLLGIVRAAPLQTKALSDAVMEAIHKFVGQAEQSDDQTILAIYYKGN